MVKTEIKSLDNLTKEAIDRIFHAHYPIPFPTETVYGLGAKYDDIKTIEAIYEIKGRPKLNPLIVHISDLSMLDDLVLEVSRDAKKLIDHFFPGPLTLVFKKKQNVSDLVTSNQDTVAVRMPESETARRFIRLCGKPLVAPSANLSGKPSATSSLHVFDDFKNRLPLIIEGEVSKFGIESTILDMSKFPYTILRPGVITLPQIESVLKLTLDQKVSDIIAPGMKYPHYEPKNPLYILKGSDLNIIKFLENKKDVLFIGHHRFLDHIKPMLDMGDSIEALTSNLYKTLRETNSYQNIKLYTHEVNSDAYMNRLLKAANYKVINV